MDDLKEINTENVLMFQYCAYLYPGEDDESVVEYKRFTKSAKRETFGSIHSLI